MKRRDFNAKIASAAAGIAFVPSAKIAPYQNPEYVRALAERIALQKHDMGSAPVVSSALRHVHSVAKTARCGAVSLQMAGSDLAREVMLVLYDAQHLDRAEEIGHLALMLAQSSKDFEAQARIYATLSQLSTYRGQGAKGSHYAELGLRLPDMAGEFLALLRVRLGRSLAIIPGQEGKARKMLDQALTSEDVSAFATADIVGNTGVALSCMGMYSKAYDALNQASEFMDGESLLYSAQYFAHQAECALRASETELAAERIIRLVHLAPLVSSTRLNEMMRGIFATSHKWATSPGIKDARDQLRTVTPLRSVDR